MVELLEFYSRIRRLLQQAVKGGRYLHGLLHLTLQQQQAKMDAIEEAAPPSESSTSEAVAADAESAAEGGKVA